MPKIKAILFDMDGVLIDAKDWHFQALNNALALFGMEISRYDHLITYDGLPTRKKLEMITLERGLPVALHQLLNEIKQDFTLELAYTKCTPNFRHQYAISKLKDQGYRLAVCSNSVRKTVQMMLQKASILEYFEFYLSNEDVKHGKPDPEIYNKAIDKLRVRPEECLILEDNENGIRAAKASGANLLVISGTDDLNIDNISMRINEIGSGV